MKTEKHKFERFRDLRIANGFTQAEVAKYLNIKQNTYSQYEIGKRNYPIAVVIKLVKLYQISADYLIGLTNNPSLHYDKS